MPRTDKRWWVAGGAGLLLLGVGVVTLLRPADAPRTTSESGEAAAPGLASREYGSTATTPPGAAPAAGAAPTESPAAAVDRLMTSWRNAILVRDADTVLALDRAFLADPDRYRDALTASAKGDADARVRAFCVRVLGKLKEPDLAEVFQQLLSDESPYVRQNAAWGLGELAADMGGRTAARQALAELRQARTKDPAGDVRTAAKDALSRLE